MEDISFLLLESQAFYENPRYNSHRRYNTSFNSKNKMRWYNCNERQCISVRSHKNFNLSRNVHSSMKINSTRYNQNYFWTLWTVSYTWYERKRKNLSNAVNAKAGEGSDSNNEASQAMCGNFA